MRGLIEIQRENDATRVENAARKLLDALDRMSGSGNLSYNVQVARDELRQIFPASVAPEDRWQD